MAGAGGGTFVNAEKRHYTVAGVLVGNAAGRIDGLPGDFEIAVQEEYDVIRQARLGQPRKAAQVGKEHTDLALLAAYAFGLCDCAHRVGAGRNQRHD